MELVSACYGDYMGDWIRVYLVVDVRAASWDGGGLFPVRFEEYYKLFPVTSAAPGRNPQRWPLRGGHEEFNTKNVRDGRRYFIVVLFPLLFSLPSFSFFFGF